ncbi:1837_t:CDS:2, partial [Acaulospora morrowiae]
IDDLYERYKSILHHAIILQLNLNPKCKTSITWNLSAFGRHSLTLGLNWNKYLEESGIMNSSLRYLLAEKPLKDLAPTAPNSSSLVIYIILSILQPRAFLGLFFDFDFRSVLLDDVEK